MAGKLAFLYGLLAYAIFLAAFLYTIAFTGNLIVPKSIDSGVRESTGRALLINAVLLSLFALQHSGMARSRFKEWWTKIIPREVERSTYVLISSLLLLLLFWQWRAIPTPVWTIESPAVRAVLWALFCSGWLIVLISSYLIDHYELVGLRQVYRNLTGQHQPVPGFQTPALYKRVRHPLYLGFLVAFWATPVMTLGHLEFAVFTTAYILLGITFEERDLIRSYGNAYRRYRKEVPMLLPIRRKK